MPTIQHQEPATRRLGDRRHLAPPELLGIDHVEWWVGNARAFAGFLAGAFGFEPVAYAGPETGRADRVSHLLVQGRVRFLVTGALTPDSPVASHVREHGDGVRDVCFAVSDVEAAYDWAMQHGARPERPPATDEDEHGVVRHAAIGTYGDTVHTFLDRSDYDGLFGPQFVSSPLTSPGGPAVGLGAIDHIVGNVELGKLDRWVGYYEDVLGLVELLHFSDDQISTEYSALMSTVVWNGDEGDPVGGDSGSTARGGDLDRDRLDRDRLDGDRLDGDRLDRDRVVLPLNEPAEGRRKSQIEEYLDYYRSPGVQHLALRTPDIVQAVKALRARGVRFLEVPPEYYDEARQRMAGVELPWKALAELNVLVDRDADGYLLQIFTENLGDRPTVFFEIIQREGARGFGEGNFKALFQAIERAQAARGNL